MLDTIEKGLSPLQMCRLKSFGSKVNKFGVNFAVCNDDGNVMLLGDGGKFKSDQEQLVKLSRQVLNQDSKGSSAYAEAQVYLFDEGNQVLAAILKSDVEVVWVALVDCGCDRRWTNDEVRIASEMLGLLAEDFQAEGQAEGEARGEARGQARGQAEGQAKAVLAILDERGVPASESARARIMATSDSGTLDRWVRLAVTVPTVDDLIAG